MALSHDMLHRLDEAPEETLMAAALQSLRGQIALVSSFGAESALLLAMAAEIDPDVPVLFLETGRHFPETLAYRDTLIQHLGLRDVRSLSPTREALAARDPESMLADFDPDACCALRKVEPLDVVLPHFDAWISGRKRAQAASRTTLPLLERQPGGQLKINPLASWTAREIDAEMTRRALPRHPLASLGYTSIGCAPCTRPITDGEDLRAGRWSGMAKTECGIHKPNKETTAS